MEDKIIVTIGEDHAYECSTDIIGRAGEGNASQLVIEIPEKLCACSVYLDIEKPSGEKFRTKRLTVVDRKAIYDVEPYLLTEDGEIKVQVIFRSENGQTWKSYTKRYKNQESINALEEMPEKEDLFSSLAQAIEQALDSADRAEEEAEKAKENADRIAQMMVEMGLVVRIKEVTLTANGWSGSNNLYSQTVTIDGVTPNSQVDLTPSVEQLVVFYEKDLTFVTENDNGVVTVYAIGQKPTSDYTIQATITEVV